MQDLASNSVSLAGKRIIVTGGFSGIGAAAVKLSESGPAGAHLIAADSLDFHESDDFIACWNVSNEGGRRKTEDARVMDRPGEVADIAPLIAFLCPT